MRLPAQLYSSVIFSPVFSSPAFTTSATGTERSRCVQYLRRGRWNIEV